MIITMYALHRLTSQTTRIIFYRQHYFVPEENNYNMCCQHPLPDLPDLYCYEQIPLDDDDMDLDLPDILDDDDLDDQLIMNYMDEENVRPLWLEQTNFNWNEFYFLTIQQRYRQQIVYTFTNPNTQQSTTMLRFENQFECDEFMNCILYFLQEYSIYPDISFTDLDSIIAIYLGWLGGYLCEQIRDEQGDLTFEILLFYHHN